jgi:hypothetical protein
MTRGVSEGVVTVSRLKELLKLDPKNKTLLPVPINFATYTFSMFIK